MPPRRSRIASIAVGGDLGSSVVVYRDNVSEEVFFEEIPVKRGFSVGSIPVTHSDRTSGFVVEVNQVVVAPRFRRDPPAASDEAAGFYDFTSDITFFVVQ